MWTHNWCGSHTAIHPQAIQHEVIHYLSDQLLERSTTRAIHYLAIHYGEIHYLAIHYLAIHYLAIRYGAIRHPSIYCGPHDVRGELHRQAIRNSVLDKR